MALLAFAAVLAVFGLIVGIMSKELRRELREGVVQRSAETWAPLTRFQVNRALDDDLLGVLEVEDAILYALMDTYEVDGALGVYVFDGSGAFISGLPLLEEISALSKGEVSKAIRGETWAELVEVEGDPVLEMSIPLFDEDGKELLATARYAMEGELTVAEFEAIDRKLAWQAGGAFLGGGAAIGLVFAFFGFRLKQAQVKLEERAKKLGEANAELAMVAKTSAVGAVASHLIHGLKNPLAGIRQHIASGGEGLEDEDWDYAQSATKRMQTMINDVVGVLRSDALGEGDAIPVEELFNILSEKTRQFASEKRVQLEMHAVSGSTLSERKLKIALLILENLTNNGIEACDIGGEVAVRGHLEDAGVSFEVTDTGGGFSDSAKKSLFSPTHSRKPDGAGIGLAISQQMARHIGAKLELVKSDASGSTLKLTVCNRVYI
ncbi:MAG: HAMP domain-containing sensor histidine kinase [Verrucomicrobiota bacterium]